MRFLTFILLLNYSSVIYALGLGEVNLKSHLGESLLAKINVADLEDRSGSSCFTVTDTSDPPAFRKANISLKATSSGHVLTITTHEVINEPIVNLSVSFSCDTTVSRDYVLLLDPAGLIADTQTTTEDSTQADPDGIIIDYKQQTSSSSKKSRGQTHVSQNQNNDVALSPDGELGKVVVKKKQKNKTASKPIDVKLIESYTGLPQTEIKTQAGTPLGNKVPAPTSQQASTDKPFLVISKGEAASQENTNKSGMSLRLATEVDLTRPEASIAPTAATDVLDEATVMSKRLAYLEKQLVNLQNRNAQLAAAVNQQKAENEAFNWQKWLLIGLGIIAILGIAEWVRRKIISRREAAEEAKWFDVEDENEEDYSEDASEPDDSTELSDDSANTNSLMDNHFASLATEENSKTASTPYSSPVQSESSFASPQKTSTPEEDNREGILDDVNVFIEHGRPTLAIQLLQNFVSESPAESPAIWLKLLSLLAKEGHEAEYNDTIAESNKHFKIKTEKFGDPVDSNQTIEKHTHITSHLEGVWGSPYALTYLNDLIYNRRAQPSEGLNQGEFDDLFLLRQVAQQLEISKPNAEKVSLYQSNLVNAAIANTNFNESLFSETNAFGGDETDATEHRDDLDLMTEFNAYEALNGDDDLDADANIDTSESQLIPHKDNVNAEIEEISLETPAISTASSAIEFEPPKQNAMLELKLPMPHQAEEIDFVLPSKQAEISKNLDDFMLEFEVDKKVALDPPVAVDTTKSKPKKKTKPTEKKQAELNEIEWILPEITPKTEE